MSGKPSVKLNGLLNMILSASAVLISLVTYPYVTRVLSPAGVGIVSFAQSVVGYFSLFAVLGMPTYGMRAISLAKENEEDLTNTVTELVSISFATHLVATIALFVAVALFPSLREIWQIFTVLGVTMLIEALDTHWYFRGVEKYTYLTLLNIVGKLVSAICLFLLIKSPKDTVLYSIVVSISFVIISVGNFAVMKKEVPGFRRLVKPRIMVHLRPVMVFFLISCASTICSNMDVVMLKSIWSEVETGYYNVGLKVKVILMTISSSLWTVILPKATDYWEKKNMEAVEGLVRKALHVVYSIQFPLTVFFMVFAGPTVMILGGEAYKPAIIPFVVTLSAIFAIGISNVIGGDILVGMGAEKLVLVSQIGAVIINLIMNYLLITFFATVGASTATVLSELTVMIIQIIYVRKRTNLKVFVPKHFFTAFGATAVGILSSFWILLLNINVFLQLFTGALIFGLVFLGAMLIMKDDFIKDLLGTAINVVKKVLKIEKK